MAARLQRKHEWAITTILPEENRPVRLYPVGSGQSGTALKSTSEKNLRFSDLSLAKTLRVLTFTPLTMLQASAQTVDFKVCRHFGEGQGFSVGTGSRMRRSARSVRGGD